MIDAWQYRGANRRDRPLRTGNVGKWRVESCSPWIVILAIFARQV